jgi:hypothetical protein
MATNRSAEDPHVIAVRLGQDERAAGRYEVYEEAGGGRRVYAWGFQSPQAARHWVEQHNDISPFVRLELND